MDSGLDFILFFIFLFSYFSIFRTTRVRVISQIRYSLVVILELNDVSEVQYKDVMMIDDGKYQ